MGIDKAFIHVSGFTLLDRAVRALRVGGAEPVVVVGGDRPRVEAAGHEFIPDDHPGEGPLGGIITALRSLDCDLVIVLACDLLDPSPIAVSALVDVIGSADVAVPVVNGRAQWLHAGWRRASLRPLVAAFDAGERAPRQAVEELQVIEVVDAAPRWFVDADTPDELPAGTITELGHRDR